MAKKGYLGILFLLVCFSGFLYSNPKSLEDDGKISLVGCSDGIEIPLEQLNNGYHYKCRIDRVNVSRGGERFWHITVQDFSNPSVVDCFVNPGDVYKYYITYMTYYGDEILKEIETEDIKAVGGFGEVNMSYLTSIGATYNEKTNDLVLNQELEFSDDIKEKLKITGAQGKFLAKFVNDKGQKILMCELGKEINLERELYFWRADSYVGGKINLSEINLAISLGDNYGIVYFEPLEISDVPAIKSEYQITDNSVDLITEEISDGIKIIPPAANPKECEFYAIDRYNKTTDVINKFYISITDLECEKIVDPFIASGNEYQYRINFIKPGHGWMTIGRTKWSEPIKAENGIGELGLAEKIVFSSYSDVSGKMKFKQSENLTKYKKAMKKAYGGFGAHLEANLVYVGDNKWLRGDLTQRVIDWNSLATKWGDAKSSVNKNYYFNKIEIKAWPYDNNNISFSLEIYPDMVKNYIDNIPQTIFIPGK